MSAQFLPLAPGGIPSGAGAVGGLADEQADTVAGCRGSVDLAGPPACDRPIAGDLEAPRPVDLRGDIVDPALADPQSRIGVEVVVCLDSGASLGPRGIGAGVAPDRERRDPEVHPGLDGVDSVMQALDERVDIRSAPVALRGVVSAIGLEGLAVTERPA